MMARPTLTSAAATTMTKNTAAWPPMSDNERENVTKVRFTAFSISSTPISTATALRFDSAITVPIPKISPDTTR